MDTVNTVYLCGPAAGKPQGETAGRFGNAARKIRAAAKDGGQPLCTANPALFCQPDLEWHMAMRRCVGNLARCKGIALLQGWRRSRGAMLELRLAQELRIPVVHIEPPLDYEDLNELFAAAPESLRYYNARIARFHGEGAEPSLAEDRATAELANRYLDPHGFEYMDIEEREQHGS